MTTAPLPVSEWRHGWRIVLGCALASGAGIVLLFFTFSLFLLPLAAELGVSRGEIGAIQALVVTAAPGSIVFGWLTDRYGFKRVCGGSMLAVVVLELLLAAWADQIWSVALCVMLLGFFGAGTTAVTITRPVTAHFHRHRGTALGLVVTGVSVTTMLVPPALQAVLAELGWRGGMTALACFAGVIGLPAALLLVPASPVSVAHTASSPATDWSFLRDRDFWLMAGSLITASIAATGFIGQLSPVMQEEGLSAAQAALALTLFAAGQFFGRLCGGWLLDRCNPRLIALAVMAGPALGFMLLWGISGIAAVALFAGALIGLQQGGEVDLFAYYTGRRYEIGRYATVYGMLLGLAWIGNAIGLVGIGFLHDATGNYAAAQLLGAGLLLASAALIAPVRLPPRLHR